MLSPTFLFLALALWPVVTQAAGSGPFSSPDYVANYGSWKYNSNDVWYTGQTRDIAYSFDGTDEFVNYTIAIWQQDLQKSVAQMGPVVHTTLLPSVVGDSITWKWTVQLYDFDLSTSNVFFFWLRNNTASDIGFRSAGNFTSAYFNISNEDVSSSSNSASSSSATSVPNFSSTGLSTPSATATPAAGNSNSSSSGSTNGGGGISTAAGIGIGVGVGLAALSAIACVGLDIWHKRRRKHSGQRNQELSEPGEPRQDSNANMKPPEEHTASSLSCDTVAGHTRDPSVIHVRAVNDGTPVELNAGGIPQPAEMDANER